MIIGTVFIPICPICQPNTDYRIKEELYVLVGKDNMNTVDLDVFISFDEFNYNLQCPYCLDKSLYFRGKGKSIMDFYLMYQ